MGIRMAKDEHTIEMETTMRALSSVDYEVGSEFCFLEEDLSMKASGVTQSSMELVSYIVQVISSLRDASRMD